jgi:hypothetical protein
MITSSHTDQEDNIGVYVHGLNLESTSDEEG